MPPEHYCEEHQVAFGKHTKGDKVWYSHKLSGGGWCNEPDKVIRTSADLPGPKALVEPLKPDKNRLMPLPYQVEIDARARNTALMQACEVAKNAQGEVTVNSLLLVADRFYRWLIKLPSDAPERKETLLKTESGVVAPEATGLAAKVKAKIEVDKAQSNIDIDWLTETLKIVKWSETTAKSWMKSNLNWVMTNESLVEICNKLPIEKLERLVKKLQDLRESAGK